MSSRGNFLGTGPASGVYTPKPTPQKAEEMPVYINDELLDLGGRLNNILEGGAFPPQSQMPKRVKEPMMIYFTQPIPPAITSPGVWLYRKEKWWKIIDDPSAITQNLTVYKKFPKGSTRPPKPPINKYQVEDLNGWKYVPEPNDDANDQWMSVATFATTDPDNPKVDWSEPIMFNTEGTAGQPGADGYSIEFRYLSSTIKPTIADKNALKPVTPSGDAFVRDVTPVSHPDKNFVWMTQTYIRDGALGQPWTDPVKYSTPDTTKAASAYSIAANSWPTFNANAAGLPGPSWYSTVPSNIPEGWNIWRSDRLEWTDGTGQTIWSTPYKANGTVGARSETRYIASTNTPDIRDKLTREPVTSEGIAYTIPLPTTSHPNKTYIWAITGVVNRLNEMEIEWSDPAKYATPDTTNTAVCFAIGSLTSFPSFTNTNPGLPGDDWSRDFPGAVEKGEYIWESQRLEWSTGESQTNWTTPVRTIGYDGTDGTSTEQRYKASTSRPSISVSDRNPVGWTTTVPAVTHPNNSFVWVTIGRIDSSDKLVGTWSVPARYATPDATKYVYAYSLGTGAASPAHNPNASGLPGPSWNYNPPQPAKGQRVWVTERYQWNDSTPVTSWSPPTLFSGSDGTDGNHGNDGMTLVEVFKNSTTQPPEIPDAERKYPPAGWSKKQETPPMGSTTWVSRNYVRGSSEEATTTMYNYSGVSRLSGYPGQDGNPGTDGTNGVDGTTFYTWIMYADTDTGGGISGLPTGKKYVGFSYNQRTPTPSLNGFDYAWYKLEGSQGIPGKPGVDGVTTYTWVKYADTPTSGMSDSALNKKYLGLAHNKTVQQESTNYGDYQWSLIKGDQGVPGAAGSDGATFYTWIKYADTPTSGMSDDPAGKEYLGVAYNKLSQQESTDYKLYQWSLIKGLDGTNGTNGLPGPPGINGNPGADGSPGAGFYRLPMTNFTSWPSQQTVDSAFRSAFGRDSEQDDVLTIYDDKNVSVAETRRKSDLGQWVAAELLVHGDMVLRGTIVADRIAAGAITTDKLAAGSVNASKIVAGSIVSDKIAANVSLSAPNITGGQLNIGAGTFVVNSVGALTATSANITGSINATSGTFRGTVTGSRIEASSIGIGSQFSVDSNGKMTCSGATIGGTLNSVNGTFTGTLSAVGGTFTGRVTAGTIEAGASISGAQINVPASSPKFTVTAAGDMICNNATINGSIFNNGELRGTGINVNNRFVVTNDGTTTIKSGDSGSRMIIKNDRIEVWEGNVLRVVLGRL